MRNTLIFAMLLSYLGTTAQNVAYYLPKKIIYVTVPFNIVEKKLYKVDRTTGQLAKEPEKIMTTVKINGDIKVASKLLPGSIDSMNLDKLGKGGKSFSFDITFDEKGNGLIASVNASQTPATADIIKGTVSIVGTVIKLAASIFAVVGGDEQPKYQEITTEQNIEETRVIELTNTSNDQFNLTIEPNTQAINIAGTKPTVEVKIIKISQVDGISNGAVSRNPGIELHYRIPAEHSIQVIIKNNQLIKEQLVINERILIPQTGKEVALLIPILKKKKTIEVAFDKETGNLSKYGLKKESQLKENMETISDAIGTLNNEISGLKTELKLKNEKEEADRKKTEEENINKDLKDEIGLLKLEKEKLDLIVQKRTLEEEIAAKKIKNKEK